MFPFLNFAYFQIFKFEVQKIPRPTVLLYSRVHSLELNGTTCDYFIAAITGGPGEVYFLAISALNSLVDGQLKRC
jgi:hypothetical protein